MHFMCVIPCAMHFIFYFIQFHTTPVSHACPHLVNEAKEEFTQDLAAGKWQRWDMNPVPKHVLLYVAYK